jgi:hypothetical protein
MTIGCFEITGEGDYTTTGGTEEMMRIVRAAAAAGGLVYHHIPGGSWDLLAEHSEYNNTVSVDAHGDGSLLSTRKDCEPGHVSIPSLKQAGPALLPGSPIEAPSGEYTLQYVLFHEETQRSLAEYISAARPAAVV